MIRSKQLDIEKIGKLEDIIENELLQAISYEDVDALFEALEHDMKWYDRLPSIKGTIKFWYNSTIRFFSNVWIYRKFLIYDGSWQFDEMYDALLIKLKKLEYTFEFDSHVMDAPRMLKQVRTARILCERIIKEDYDGIFNSKVFPKLDMRRKYQMSAYSYKQDRAMLWDIIKKREHDWWD